VSDRIPFETIKEYIELLLTRGLKAVILTGGGEPVLYPHFNELVSWIKKECNLPVALITNGTLFDRVDKDVLDMFSWIRVSLNSFDGYEDAIKFPQINGVMGASVVYTGESVDEMETMARFIAPNVEYVRVLPDCSLEQEALIKEHEKIDIVLKKLNDKRFFQQFKIHGKPCSAKCHQAYFRPYLSELNGGTVFPCDSLVLNYAQKHFNEKYAICKSSEVLDFLDGKIKMRFNATEDCEGCVFTSNIMLLNQWLLHGVNRFEEYDKGLNHEEFV
jgi:MoaA/NifB/PqqE/SkfB family radical SAM enzyme